MCARPERMGGEIGDDTDSIWIPAFILMKRVRRFYLWERRATVSFVAGVSQG